MHHSLLEWTHDRLVRSTGLTSFLLCSAMRSGTLVTCKEDVANVPAHRQNPEWRCKPETNQDGTPGEGVNWGETGGSAKIVRRGRRGRRPIRPCMPVRGTVRMTRVHLDVQVGGGRDQTPWEIRWPRVVEAVERLTAAGASVVCEVEQQGRPDHVVMTDPEGNEFCLL
jgi:Glyoxalase-like domain